MVDLDVDSEDKDNPEFFISYEDCIEENEWYFLPLMEGYLKGFLRFVDTNNS